jgi:hypothetical protein
MIIYNVTISLDPSIHKEWLDWMINKHIPDVMDTGYFLENKICKLLVDDEVTYAIQYTCKDTNTLEMYQKKCSVKLQEEHNEKFRDKFGAFRTILEIIHQH